MTKAYQMWRKVRWPAVFVGVLLSVFVGSYIDLYRRGVAEAEPYGYDYFFYVPFADVVSAHDSTRRLQLLGPVYCPLNKLQYRWLGGRPACKCILFGLSPRPSGG